MNTELNLWLLTYGSCPANTGGSICPSARWEGATHTLCSFGALVLRFAHSKIRAKAAVMKAAVRSAAVLHSAEAGHPSSGDST